MAQPAKINRSKLNLYLDLALLLAFVVEMEEHFTGLRNHEVLGLAFAIGFIIHIILHWAWIVTVTREFFTRLLHESRLNYLLNLALFIDMAIVVITGILISRTLGLELAQGSSIQYTLNLVHVLTSSLSLVIVGLHFALHWKWIVTHTQKYLLRNPFAGTGKPKSASTHTLPTP